MKKVLTNSITKANTALEIAEKEAENSLGLLVTYMKLKKIKSIKLHDFEDENELRGVDEFYEMPVFSVVGKFSTYDEFSIVEVLLVDEKLTFRGLCRGESQGEYSISGGEIDLYLTLGQLINLLEVVLIYI